MITYCSSETTYLSLRLKFAFSLVCRGFPISVVLSLFRKVGYDLRDSLNIPNCSIIHEDKNMWFVPSLYSSSSNLLDLEGIIRRHWKTFDSSRHRELPKFLFLVSLALHYDSSSSLLCIQVHGRWPWRKELGTLSRNWNDRKLFWLCVDIDLTRLLIMYRDTATIL